MGEFLALAVEVVKNEAVLLIIMVVFALSLHKTCSLICVQMKYTIVTSKPKRAFSF